MSVLINRFLSAVRLCSSPLTIKQRLARAWAEHLDAIAINELPYTIQRDFIELRKAMYMRKPLSGETAPQASIRKMSAAEAAAHTETIIALYSELIRSHAEAASFHLIGEPTDSGSVQSQQTEIRPERLN